MRVLLLEDDVADAALLERSLRDHFEFDLKRATNKQEFAHAMHEFDPQLILADYKLPQMTALDALTMLQRENRRVPFILVTGSPVEQVAVDCMRAGADDYILKQSLARLPGAVQNALEKHAALRQRLQAEEALRASEALYRLIMETTRDLIVMTDREGTPIYISPSSLELLGFTPEELIRNNTMCMVHPDDHTTAIEAFRRSAVEFDGNPLEIRCKHRNGEWRVFECMANWVVDQEQPFRAVLIFRDITKRRNAEQERGQAIAELERREQDLLHTVTALKQSHEELEAAQLQLIQANKMEAVGQLAAGVAHEVKNPLTVLLLGVEYLRKHLDSNAFETREILADMEDSIHRANSVVRGLLDFSAPRILQRQSTEINLPVERALTFLRHEFVRARVSVVKDLDPSLPPLYLDRNKIEQALINLLLNAIQAMKAGGTITVHTTHKPLAEFATLVGPHGSRKFQPEVVVVIVEDSGAGIPADKLPQSSTRSSPPSPTERAPDSACASSRTSWNCTEPGFNWPIARKAEFGPHSFLGWRQLRSHASNPLDRRRSRPDPVVQALPRTDRGVRGAHRQLRHARPCRPPGVSARHRLPGHHHARHACDGRSGGDARRAAIRCDSSRVLDCGSAPRSPGVG